MIATAGIQMSMIDNFRRLALDDERHRLVPGAAGEFMRSLVESADDAAPSDLPSSAEECRSRLKAAEKQDATIRAGFYLMDTAKHVTEERLEDLIQRCVYAACSVPLPPDGSDVYSVLHPPKLQRSVAEKFARPILRPEVSIAKAATAVAAWTQLRKTVGKSFSAPGQYRDGVSFHVWDYAGPVVGDVTNDTALPDDTVRDIIGMDEAKKGGKSVSFPGGAQIFIDAVCSAVVSSASRVQNDIPVEILLAPSYDEKAKARAIVMAQHLGVSLFEAAQEETTTTANVGAYPVPVGGVMRRQSPSHIGSIEAWSMKSDDDEKKDEMAEAVELAESTDMGQNDVEEGFFSRRKKEPRPPRKSADGFPKGLKDRLKKAFVKYKVVDKGSRLEVHFAAKAGRSVGLSLFAGEGGIRADLMAQLQSTMQAQSLTREIHRLGWGDVQGFPTYSARDRVYSLSYTVPYDAGPRNGDSTLPMRLLTKPFVILAETLKAETAWEESTNMDPNEMEEGLFDRKKKLPTAASGEGSRGFPDKIKRLLQAAFKGQRVIDRGKTLGIMHVTGKGPSTRMAVEWDGSGLVAVLQAEIVRDQEVSELKSTLKRLGLGGMPQYNPKSKLFTARFKVPVPRSGSAQDTARSMAKLRSAFLQTVELQRSSANLPARAR